MCYILITWQLYFFLKISSSIAMWTMWFSLEMSANFLSCRVPRWGRLPFLRFWGCTFVISMVLCRVPRESLRLFLSPKCLKFVGQLRMLQTSGQMHALALTHNMDNCPNRSSFYISTESPNMWNTLMHSNCISATVVAREQTEITNFISFSKYLYLKPKSWVLE